MYTLKIKWFRYEEVEETAGSKEQTITSLKMVDETTLFILADEVRAYAEKTTNDEMKLWTQDDYMDYRTINNPGGKNPGPEFVARLIEVIKDGKSIWYLASHAWLLGPDGKTIERLQ